MSGTTSQDGPWYKTMTYDYENSSIIVVFILSLLADIFILSHHWQNPPHPKFMLLLYRKLFIALHVVSGTCEIIAFVVAFFLENPAPAVIIAAVLDIFHDISAFAQTPNVFGVQAIMHPAYIGVTSVKLMMALVLLSNPHSLEWSIRLFAMHHIYVWCRVFYVLLEAMKIFQTNIYSIAILLAGFMLISIGLGPAGPLMFMAFLAVYWWGFVPLFYTKEGRKQLRVERALNMFVNPAYQNALHSAAAGANKDMSSTILEALSPKEQAQLLYDSLVSRDRTKPVTAGVAVGALQSWGFPPDAYSALLRFKAEETVTFEAFFRAMAASMGAFRTPGLTAVARSDRERADAVFSFLDLDNSGELEIKELKILLVSWGMTTREAEETMDKLDSNGDGFICRDEFFKNFVPVWRYAWDEIKTSVRQAHILEDSKHAQAI